MILCFITSRPSYSRIKTVLHGFEEIGLEYGVICNASAVEANFGNVAELVESDGFNVIKKINTQLSSSTGVTSIKTTALGLISSADIINDLKPKAVITIADRYETIATAIAASYQNIPCIHIQGGEITGNIDDKVRDAVSSLSDIHFPATNRAAKRLQKLTSNPKKVFNYGCPGVDLYISAPQFSRTFTLTKVLEKSIGNDIDTKLPYTVIMMHPDTCNIVGAASVIDTLLEVSLKAELNVIWFWPNSDPGSEILSKKIRIHREFNPSTKIRLVKNIESDLFINLLRHSIGLIGNSSVGVREAGVIGIPTVDIGDRQRSREKHQNVINVEYNASVDEIIAALKPDFSSPCYVYGKGNAGKRIANRIKSLFSKSSK